MNDDILRGGDDAGTKGAGIGAVGECTGGMREVATTAGRATVAKPLRPTPAMPAAPPDLVSTAGDAKRCVGWFDGAGEGADRTGWWMEGWGGGIGAGRGSRKLCGGGS